MAGSGTFLDLDFSANPKTGHARKALPTSYGGATKAGFPLALRGDGYLDPSIHPPGGLLGGSLEYGDHLSSLPNGAFLDGLVGWTNTSTGAGAAAIDAVASLSGTNALKLTTSAAADVAQVAGVKIPVVGGKPAYFGVLAKTVSGSATLALALAFFDATGAALTSNATATAIAAFTPSAAYAEASAFATVPAAARFMTVTPSATGAAGVINVGQVRYDQNLLSKFYAAPAGHRRALSDYTIHLADRCNLATTTDHTAALRACLADLVAQGGGELVLPPGVDVYVSAAVAIPGASGISIKIRGFGARMRRTGGYTGSIFVYDGSVASNCRIMIEGMWFFSDYSKDPAPTAGSILIQNTGAHQLHLENLIFWDQYVGVDHAETSGVKIRHCKFFQSSQAGAAGYAGYAGFQYRGHIYDCALTTSCAYAQNNTASTCLQFGILIQGADGLQVTDFGATGQYGVYIEAGHGYPIDDVYFANCVFDDCSLAAAHITGNNGTGVFFGMRFVGCHFNAHPTKLGSTNSAALVIDGNADGIQFSGCNFGLASGFGVYLSGQKQSYIGVNKKNISFTECVVFDNNQANNANTHGIYIDCPGVRMVNCSSQNITSAGKQSYGCALTTNAQNVSLVGCDFTGNVTGSLYTDPNATGLINSGNRT